MNVCMFYVNIDIQQYGPVQMIQIILSGWVRAEYNKIQEMSQQFKKGDIFHRNKRLAFAQEIRTRDRQRKMQQLRTDMHMKQKVRKWLQHTHVDSFSLYNYMREQKIQQANAAVVIGEWLATAKPDIVVENKLDNLRWGYILATVIEYRYEQLEMVLVGYLDVIIANCHKYNDYQVLFALLSSAIVSSDVISHSRHSPNTSTVMHDRCQQLLSQSICRCLQLKPCLHPPPSSIPYHQLKFYNHCFMPYTKHMLQLTQNQQFIHTLIHTLDNSIDSPQMMRQCLRLLISISYYDNSKYEDSITNVMVEKGVLGSARFILEFVAVEHELVLCYALMLLGNVVQNVGVDPLIEGEVMGPIKNIIESGTNTPTDTHTHAHNTCKIEGDGDGHRYSKNTVRYACCCYLTIIQQVSNSEHQLKKIRQYDSIPCMLSIIHAHAQYDPQIIQIAYNAFDNLLSIGEEIREYHNSQINPYALAIKHHQGPEVFKCHARLYELVDQYNIE